eukprot:Tbor_TRINITY_DN4972_c3_g1::TRINITY_DN4972_c3_g1_i14::g.9890::m.9890
MPPSSNNNNNNNNNKNNNKYPQKPYNKDEARRVQNKYFTTDRQAHFRKISRKEIQKNNLKKKDDERRRMEEYRKLCIKEGIGSERLKEYDIKRSELNNNFDNKIREIDEDLSLKNSEKKKMKFSMKRSFAGTTVAALDVGSGRKKTINNNNNNNNYHV